MKERGLIAGDCHLLSGKLVSSSLGFQGARGYFKTAFSQCTAKQSSYLDRSGRLQRQAVRRKYSENSNFSLQSKLSQDFCPVIL